MYMRRYLIYSLLIDYIIDYQVVVIMDLTSIPVNE